MGQPFVLLATPTAGGIVTAPFAVTLAEAGRVCRDLRLDWRFDYLDGADIVMARNGLANRALEEPDCTHVLFVDSDMSVPGAAIRRLFALGAPMAGLIYATRGLDLEAYARARRQGFDAEEARALASVFNVRFGGPRIALVDGVCEVEGVGFGTVLIRRDLLQRLAASPHVRRVESPVFAERGLTAAFHDFFDELRRPDGTWLSEDYSFCARVRAIGERILAVASYDVRHVGHFDYGAPFEAWVRAQARIDRQRQSP